MDEKAVQFVIAIFDSEAGAEETLKRLKAERGTALKGVQAAVAMCKDEDGQIQYKDVGMTPVKGAAAGVVIGAVVGIASGGVGLVLGAAGALLGGVVGSRRREGRAAAEQVNQVVASIPSGSSALLTVVEAAEAAAFEALLGKSSEHTFTAEITADLTAQLDKHAETAHNALVDHLSS